MRIRGIGRLKAIARRTRNKITPGSVILLYHRVANLQTDAQLLAVSPKNFEEQLEVIKRIGVPRPLSTVVNATRNGKRIARGVVITFDDGAADNLHNAKPALEKHDVPATVFIATDYIGSNKEFWWDELERIFLLPRKQPDRLELAVDGRKLEWDLSNAADYTESDFQKQKTWNVLATDAGARQRIYLELFDLIRSLSHDERASVMDQLRSWSGLDETGRKDYLALSTDEIKQLASTGLVEIGAHTVTHPVLSKLAPIDQLKEIVDSKTRLESIVDKPISTFAYPYGTRSDYSAETVSLVKQAGFDSACANYTGVVQSNARRFELPRFVVRDWNGEEFKRRLLSWFVSD